MSVVGAAHAAGHLIDTNVLLRSVEAGHPMNATALEALRQLTLSGAALCIAPQNLIEFWVVATRPVAVNGLGLTPAQALKEMSNFKAAFQLLPETPAIFAQWERIAVLYSISGKQAHDTRLVAVMKVNGIDRVLTFNAADFSRYAAGEAITIVDPLSVAASTP